MDALGIYPPSSKPRVKFFFIVSESDISVCHALYGIFSQGYKPMHDASTGGRRYVFPPLATCIKQPFSTSPNGIAIFDKKQHEYMLLSETMLKIRNDDFLLYSNFRYKWKINMICYSPFVLPVQNR